MARIATRTFDKAEPSPPPAGIAGAAETRAYFAGAADPIHLHVHGVTAGSVLRMEPAPVDRLAYVWHGEVEAGGRVLPAGSSFIVEHGGALAVTGIADQSRITVFQAGRPSDRPRAGGQVHLLPVDRVPRVGSNEAGTAGGLHSDGTCPGCELWLNENALPGRPDIPAPEETLKGTHAHPHDEIIFVTGGQIRLGTKLFDAGTALAIAADTLYGFAPGPEGLSFITFRNSASNAIRFAAGGDYRESTFWKPVAESLKYLEPLGS